MSSELILYQTEDRQTKIQARLENETVWLTQAQLIELFGKAKSTISEHIKNIFEEGELEENSVVRNFRITAADGKDYQTNHYNLDVIISVGYRVKSFLLVKCISHSHRQQKLKYSEPTRFHRGIIIEKYG